MSGRIGPYDYDESLELEFLSFTDMPVQNPFRVDEWNTFFDLPTNGTPFTSVKVKNNKVYLRGGANITLGAGAALYLFQGYYRGGKLTKIIDNGNCITAVGGRCFYDNSNLTYVLLPAVTSVGYEVFDGCNSLLFISLALLTSGSPGTFAGCSSLTSAGVNLPSLITAGYASFSGCTSLTSINLPSLVTIEYSAFYGCTGLTSIYFPNVITVKDYSFIYATSLASVSLPAAGTILDLSFAGCTSLTTISIPSCVALGHDPNNNNVFGGVTGRTITLTVPSALMTCNGGNPDGDIQYLQANNTVTVITV